MSENTYGGVMKTKREIPKVSIIIPIYNTEKYLHKCLESVTGQTLNDIEIICVNDGSTDGSLQIMQEFASRDSRVVIVSKENGGLVSARKAGVQVATGEYIGYVDSDDYIEPDMYERMYQTAWEHQVDMVTCGYYLEGNYTTEHYDTVNAGLYERDSMEFLRENTIYNMEMQETGLRGALWCKLFRRELFADSQMQIPESISIAEDKMCLLHYILHCRSVCVMKEAFYHWCIHQESMSHKANLNYLVCVNEVYKYLCDLYAHENFTDKMRAQAEIYITELLILGINGRMGFQHSNLLRIDPYWLDALPKDSRVIIYGGGNVGEQYLRQLRCREDVVCVKYLGFEMPRAELLQDIGFDVILIAVKNPGEAERIKTQFEALGVRAEHILWFSQPEVYWKYAKAEGLLDK